MAQGETGRFKPLSFFCQHNPWISTGKPAKRKEKGQQWETSRIAHHFLGSTPFSRYAHMVYVRVFDYICNQNNST